MSAATDRLAQYNGGTYDADTNPYGFDGADGGVTGFEANLPRALNDIGVAANEVAAGAAADIATMQGLLADAETAADEAQATAGAAGAAIRYVFSSTTADADPGAGTIRLNNATQGSATTIFADVAEQGSGADVTALLDSLDDSTNPTIKGHLRLQHRTNPSKWILFTLASVTTATGYRKLVVTFVAQSSANPFVNLDPVMLSFVRAGNLGNTGAAGGLSGGNATGAIDETAVTLASAATTNIGGAAGNAVRVTGTTTITALGAAQSGARRTLTFAAALTLTHNATSLILPGGANIVTAAGDVAEMESLGGGNWRCISYTRAEALGMLQGKHTIAVLAGAWTPRGTNGPAAGSAETATNKVRVATLDFDPATAEYAQISIPMPKSWNEGTITARFDVSTASVTGGVVFGLRALGISSGDALDAVFGAGQTAAITVAAAGTLYSSTETAAITIAGSPAEGDIVVFEVYRDATNGSDTLNADARLHSVEIFLTYNASNDA